LSLWKKLEKLDSWSKKNLDLDLKNKKTTTEIKEIFSDWDYQEMLFNAIVSDFEELWYEEAKNLYQELKLLLDNPKCIDKDERNQFFVNSSEYFPSLSELFLDEKPVLSKKSLKWLLSELENILEDMEFDYQNEEY